MCIWWRARAPPRGRRRPYRLGGLTLHALGYKTDAPPLSLRFDGSFRTPGHRAVQTPPGYRRRSDGFLPGSSHDVEALPQFQTVPSVADGRYVVFDDKDLSNAFSLGTPTAVIYAIDNVTPLFAEALGGK